MECNCILIYGEMLTSLLCGNQVICVHNQIVISVGSFLHWELILAAALPVVCFWQCSWKSSVPNLVWVPFKFLGLQHIWKIKSFVYPHKTCLNPAFCSRLHGAEWVDCPLTELKYSLTCSTFHLVGISLQVQVMQCQCQWPLIERSLTPHRKPHLLALAK